MNKLIRIIGLFICISPTSLAQENKNSPVAHLYNYPGNIPSISWNGNNYVSPPEPKFATLPQCLIKNSNGLYVTLKGSGRLYKASLKNGNIVFDRADSTFYFGDNFDSFNFSYRDTLYSLGGYGFWETNGLLRYYVEVRHEWELIKLNREVPCLTGNNFDLIWYDQANGKLYFGFTKEGPGTTTDKESKNVLHFETLVLDLTKKDWQQLGTLSPFLKNDLTNITNIISSPFGQMIAFRNKNLFLDYANNKIYRLSDSKQREIEQLPTSTGDSHVVYFIDSTFYSWLTSKNLVDSLRISRNDLVKVDEKIYIEGGSLPKEAYEKTNNKMVLLIVILSVVLLITGFGYYLLRKRKSVAAFPRQQENNANYFTIPFSQLEIEVIRTVLDNSSKGNFTSIEEINKALGVSKKNIEIQKKQRSDIITSINKKYSYIKCLQQELIEKKRTDFDKRSFEYFIDSSRLNDVATIIKSQNSPTQS